MNECRIDLKSYDVQVKTLERRIIRNYGLSPNRESFSLSQIRAISVRVFVQKFVKRPRITNILFIKGFQMQIIRFKVDTCVEFVLLDESWDRSLWDSFAIRPILNFRNQQFQKNISEMLHATCFSCIFTRLWVVALVSIYFTPHWPKLCY